MLLGHPTGIDALDLPDTATLDHPLTVMMCVVRHPETIGLHLRRQSLSLVSVITGLLQVTIIVRNTMSAGLNGLTLTTILDTTTRDSIVASLRQLRRRWLETENVRYSIVSLFLLGLLPVRCPMNLLRQGGTMGLPLLPRRQEVLRLTPRPNVIGIHHSLLSLLGLILLRGGKRNPITHLGIDRPTGTLLQTGVVTNLKPHHVDGRTAMLVMLAILATHTEALLLLQRP